MSPQAATFATPPPLLHRSSLFRAQLPSTRQKPRPGPIKRVSISATATNTSADTDHTPRVAGGGRAPSEKDFNQYDGQSLSAFSNLISQPGVRMVPVWRKLFSDQLTPVVAYRCLVSHTDLETPSFLLESVYTGERVGRYSLIGARPVREVLAYGQQVTVITHKNGQTSRSSRTCDDPWALIRSMNEEFHPVDAKALPGGEALFCGGWVGYGGYDTMRYAELKSLPFSAAPEDDRGLPDLHLGLYRDVIVFDQVAKVIYIMNWVDLNEYADTTSLEGIANVHASAQAHLDTMADTIMKGSPLEPMRHGRVDLNTDAAANKTYPSNMTKEQFMKALEKVKHHLTVGDAFQIVFSQRFERWSEADPFSVYRALRIINPSPYMIYMQCEGSILVASSPEILTRVEGGVLTNRPLAGTRRRGTTEEEDDCLAKELLADEKDRSEHMMLVDLGRNDVGKVSKYGSVSPDVIMQVEKYSHVMHISSTVTGKLREGLSSWDALRATLPAGTISGAPKIRAMQIIDEIEPTKRGPYGGGIGYISFHDTMNMALALRTMVVPSKPRISANGREEWQYFLQAGAGIVFESNPEAEYTETVNKAMALNRSIDLAENAFEE